MTVKSKWSDSLMVKRSGDDPDALASCLLWS
jgi:hypothetical protein